MTQVAPTDSALTSTEQGRTTDLDRVFGDWREWRLEKRRQAFKDTKFEFNFRTFYFDRSDFNESEKQAWAFGGWVGVKTGYFLDHIAFGATLYTSTPIYAPDDRDGTTLLAPGQNGYTILGEFYAELRIIKDVGITVGAKGYDTPFINRNDTRMTPNTFEAIVLQGRVKLGTSSRRRQRARGRPGPEQRWKRGCGPGADPDPGGRDYQVRTWIFRPNQRAKCQPICLDGNRRGRSC